MATRPDDAEFLGKFGQTREQLLERSRRDIEQGLVTFSRLPDDELLNDQNLKRCLDERMSREAICEKLHCSAETFERWVKRLGNQQKHTDRQEAISMSIRTKEPARENLTPEPVPEMPPAAATVAEQREQPVGTSTAPEPQPAAELVAEPVADPATESQHSSPGRGRRPRVEIDRAALEVAIRKGHSLTELAQMFGTSVGSVSYYKAQWHLRDSDLGLNKVLKRVSMYLGPVPESMQTTYEKAAAKAAAQQQAAVASVQAPATQPEAADERAEMQSAATEVQPEQPEAQTAPTELLRPHKGDILLGLAWDRIQNLAEIEMRCMEQIAWLRERARLSMAERQAYEQMVAGVVRARDGEPLSERCVVTDREVAS